MPARDIPRYIDWYLAGELPVQHLLSERVQLDELSEAFDRLADGRSIRQVLVFDG